MKVFKNKILPIMLCAIMLSTQIIFGCLTVRARADSASSDIANTWEQEAGNIVGSLYGIVFEDIANLGHDILVFLGLETEEEQGEYLANYLYEDTTVSGQGGHEIRMSQNMKDDIQDYIDYTILNAGFSYVYSFDFETVQNRFLNQNYYQAFKNIVDANEDNLIVFANPNYATNQDISVSTLGRYAPRLYVIKNYYYLSGGITDVSNGLRYSMSPNTYNKQLPSYSNEIDIEVYAVWNTNDSGISKKYGANVTYTDEVYNLCGSLTVQNFDKDFPLWNGNTQRGFIVNLNNPMGYLWFVGSPNGNVSDNIPFYSVPTNDIWGYQNGMYTTNTNLLGDTITYGDIQEVVDNSQNYSEVINFINNYYDSNGSGGSGGSGSGGSGSDIDWGWLGKIGEVIGGLISALGNIVAGIIDAISELITSVTEGIPNVFGQLMEWLFPFLPDYLISLLSLTIMAVVIVSLVKLLRGK